MISKKMFVKVMEYLEQFDIAMDDIDHAVRVLCPDVSGLWISSVPEMFLQVLTEQLHDEKEEWLYYFCYECDMLKNKDLLSSVQVGYEQPCDTWDNVYDFLISRMQEDK